MAVSVEVPVSLLEDIFRLLYYLDRRGDRDNLHPHKPGHGHGFEHDTALWELRLKIRQLQDRAVETYLLTVGGVDEDEMRDLREWVAAGNSVYDNPCSIYGSSGCPMDFINGCRLGAEMAEDPSCFLEIGPDDIDNGACGDEPPF